MADARFDLTAPATAVLTGVALNQSGVHQQQDYDETGALLYVTQVIADGVTLPGETTPPAPGVRASRGDLAISRVNLAGAVTGVMYCRAFDHGAAISVEDQGGTPYLWLAYDAAMEPIGTAAHGRSIVRLPFINGAVIDVGTPGLDVYDAVPGASAVTPGLDLANDRMTVAYTTGSETRYRVYALAAFRAKDFSSPLYDFPRPPYPDFQSWQVFGDYLYQWHGTAYSVDNPPPPSGPGNAFFTVIDIRTGSVVQRVLNTTAPALSYREPKSIAVWNPATTPQLVFGYASSETDPRLMNLYSIGALIAVELTITAVAVEDPDPGVQLTVQVTDPLTVESWSIVRVIDGIEQPLFSGTGPTLDDGSQWLDTSPPGCIELLYVVRVQRVNADPAQAVSDPVTYVPPGGCAQGGQAVGEQDSALGCATTYSAAIHWRGGALPYPAASMDRLTEVTWGRTINDISEATVTVSKGNISPECCEALGKAEPWVHELTVYRDGELVWQGPILSTTARRESITISARDVFAWLDKIVNTHRVTYIGPFPDSAGRRAGPITYIAYNHIRLNLNDPALSVPPDYPGIMDYIVRRDTGLPTIRVVKDGSSNVAIWTEYLGNILREWTKRGLTWTTIGRRLLLRGKPTQSTRAVARLTLEDFAGEIEVIKDGANGATYAFATNQESNDISDGKTLGTGRTGTAYGRLDVLVRIEDEDTTDADLRSAARDALAGRYPVPLAISIPDGSTLTPTAPVKIAQLVPGERLDVLADAFCTPVVQGFMLSDLEVSWQNGGERVGITLIPLADVDEELGS